MVPTVAVAVGCGRARLRWLRGGSGGGVPLEAGDAPFGDEGTDVPVVDAKPLGDGWQVQQRRSAHLCLALSCPPCGGGQRKTRALGAAPPVLAPLRDPSGRSAAEPPPAGDPRRFAPRRFEVDLGWSPGAAW